MTKHSNIKMSALPVMLLVLGPHRSGTSLTARMLECLGAENSQNQSPPRGDNPTGFFEDHDVFRFNEEVLLPELARSWSNIASLDWSGLSGTRCRTLASQAEAILRRNYAGNHPLRVLKEPRLCRLLPIWLHAVECAGFAPKLVCTIRDPLSVAFSLQKRNGLSIAHGCLLYLRHWTDIVLDSEAAPKCFVSFDSIFRDPMHVLRHVAEAHLLPLPDNFDASVRCFVGNYRKADGSTRQFSIRDIERNREVPGCVKEFYKLLIAAAETGDASALHAAAQGAETALSAMGSLLEDYDQLTTHSVSMAEETYSRVAHLEQRVSELVDSTSWRVTAPLRVLGDFVKSLSRANFKRTESTRSGPPC